MRHYKASLMLTRAVELNGFPEVFIVLTISDEPPVTSPVVDTLLGRGILLQLRPRAQMLAVVRQSIACAAYQRPIPRRREYIVIGGGQLY